MSTASRFTPSLHSGAQLEKLFVGRHALADRIVERIEQAATSKTRNHSLVVGPRGAGKTHLISLLHHRIRRAIDNDGLGLATSWLDEDPWLIHSVDDFLNHIVDRLDPPPGPQHAGDPETTIRSVGATTPIVVFSENFDQILDRIARSDDQGQHRLRHLLQDSLGLVLVASSTRLSEHVRDQDSPFYGFFTTDRLAPFDTDVAAEMLTLLAAHQGDEPLANYLEGDEAKGRLAVVEHLAGGQPRMWATLNTALDVHRLDALVDHLLTRFDDLTPYYQEQLARLAPQQQRVVATLAERDRPMSTKELAEHLGADQRSVSKTMHELVDRGWVRPSDSPLTALLDGRLRYYDLAEPLVRIAFQLKATRQAEPLRIVVEFLKGWLSPTELDRASVIDSAQPYLDRAAIDDAGVAMSEVARRMHHVPATRLARYREPVVAALWEVDRALVALAEGDAEPMFALPSPVRASLEADLVDVTNEANRKQQVIELRMRLHKEARDEAGTVPHPAFEPWHDSASTLVGDHPTNSAVLANAAAWAATMHEFALAEELIERLAEVMGSDHPDTLSSRRDLVYRYRTAGRNDKAIALAEQALADCERILGPDHPDTHQSRLRLANSYWTARRNVEAIALNEQTLADRERILGPDHPDTLTSRNNLAISYWTAGRNDEAITLDEQTLADRERILGPDHPRTLTSRHNLATSYESAGRNDEAINLHEQTLADRERVLGPDHPDTLQSRGNLAISYWTAGRNNEALTLDKQTLADRERILGPDHPDTVSLRAWLDDIRS